MKALLKGVDAGRQRLSPLSITAISVGWVLVLGVADYLTPEPMSFVLFYLLAVILAGWHAGKWHAWFVALAAVITMIADHWGLRQPASEPLWVDLWNYSTRFLVFSITGWLAAGMASLTRNLAEQVEQQTARYKKEVEEHKATSSRLAESVERFEQVINNITEVFWLTDLAKSRAIYISPAYQQIWGRKCEELFRTPDSWLASVHPDDRARVSQRSHSEQAQGGYDVEYRIVRPDGEVRWIRDRAFPVRDDRGEVYRIAGVAEDITERRQTRETLRMQAAIVENMAEGVVVTDGQGLIVQMNPAAERIWGYARSDVLGKPATVFSALPEAEATAVMRGALQELETTGTWRGTFSNRRKDGALISCEAMISRIEVQGRVLMVAVEQDVTERRLAEQALARNEALYRTLFELSPDGVLLEDTEGCILDVNQAICRALGYQREELVGSSVRKLAPPESWGEVEQHLATLRAGQKLQHEVWNVRSSGERVLIRINEKPLALPDGRQGILVVARDITQTKRAEVVKEVFLSLGSKLSAASSPVEAARAIYAGADLLWNWDAASLTLYSRESDRIEPVLNCDIMDGKRQEVSPARQPAAPTPRMRRILEQGAELIPNRDSLDSDGFEMFGDKSRSSVCLMYVPLRLEGQPVGVLSIQSYTPNAYTQEDLRTLQALADYCAGALDRLRAETARRQSEELNRALLTTAMEGVLTLDFAKDPQGAIVDANEAYCRMIGYSREELLRMKITDLEAQESTEEVAQHKDLILSSPGDRFETRHRRKDGQEIPVEISACRLGSGADRRILDFVRNITERKRAEVTREAFLTLGNRLSAAATPVEAGQAIYASADLLWHWDSATLNVYWPTTDQAHTVLNYDVMDGQRQEVPVLDPVGAVSPRMRRIMHGGSELILRDPSAAPAPDSFVIGDTTRLSASLMCVPIHQEGRPIGVLSIQSYTPRAYTAEDLQTLQAMADYCGGALERIRAEAALRESEEQLRAFYDSPGGMRGIMELLEDDALVVSVNAPLAEAYGRTPESMRNLRGSQLGVPGPISALWREKLEESLTLGGPVTFEHSTDYRLPGGWMLVTVCPLHATPGAQPRFAFLATDITERKKAEESLAEALEFNRQIVSASTVGIGVYKASGQCVMANPALAQITGGTVEQLLGHDFRRLEAWRAAGIRAKAEAALATRQPQELECRSWTTFHKEVSVSVHFSTFVNQGELHLLVMFTDQTVAMQARDALRVSEARYRTLAESSPDAIFILDRNITLEYINAAGAELLRHTPAEMTGAAQSDLFPPETAQYHEEIVKRVFTTGKAEAYDEPLRFPGGEQWLETRLLPLPDAQGAVASVMGVGRDITDRKQAEQRLTEALDLNLKMLAAATLGVSAYKASGECIFANDALARIVGGSLDDLLKANFRHAKAWQDSGLVAMADEALRVGQVSSRGVFCQTRFGKRVWLDCHMASFVSNGQPHVLLMALDISERKQAEEALKMHSLVLQSMDEGVLLVGPDQTIKYANPALHSTFGYAQGELIGQHVAVLNAGTSEDTARFNLNVMRTAAGGTAWSGEYRNRRKDGSCFTSEARVNAVDLGGQTHCISVQQDITERKRTELLLQAQRKLADSLSPTSNLTTALKRLLDMTMQLGGVDAGAVYLLNETTGGMDIVVHEGGSPEFIKAVSHWDADSPQCRLASQGQAIFMPYRDLPIEHDEARRQEGLRASALIPLRHEQRVIGALAMGSHQVENIPRQTRVVIEALAAQAVGAIARIRAETEQHRLERQLLEIADREQARIGQDIHDGLCQRLVSLAFDANSLRRELSRKRRPEAPIARRLAELADEAITESRHLARGLFPVRLESEGLPPALEELAMATRQRFHILCRFRAKGAVTVPNNIIATHLYRIAQEAVANAVKHGKAKEVSIDLIAEAHQLTLEISDNGNGLAPKALRGKGGMGLHIMDYRARTIGGSLRVTSGSRGGTRVFCCVRSPFR